MLFVWSFKFPISLSMFSYHTDKAEKMGQNLTKIPFKDTFWKGTTRTRPRKSNSLSNLVIDQCHLIWSAAWNWNIFQVILSLIFNLMFEISPDFPPV